MNSNIIYLQNVYRVTNVINNLKFLSNILNPICFCDLNYFLNNVKFVVKNIYYLQDFIRRWVKKILNEFSGINNYSFPVQNYLDLRNNLYIDINKSLDNLKKIENIYIGNLFENSHDKCKEMIHSIKLINQKFNLIYLGVKNPIVIGSNSTLSPSNKIDELSNIYNNIVKYSTLVHKNFEKIKQMYQIAVDNYEKDVLHQNTDTKNYIDYIYDNLKKINLIEVFKNIDEIKTIEIGVRANKLFIDYKKEIENIFNEAIKREDKSLYSMENLDKERDNLLLNRNINIVKKFMELYHSRFKSKLQRRIKNYNINIKKPDRFKKISQKIKNKYSVLKNLQLYYRKKNGTFRGLYLHMNDGMMDKFKPLFLEDIINGTMHSMTGIFGNNTSSGCIYMSKPIYSGNQEPKILDLRHFNFNDEFSFYTKHLNIMFNYKSIPKNIFWKKSIHIPAATNFYIHALMCNDSRFKKKYINSNQELPNLPLVAFDIIMSFIPIRDMCNYHVYKSGEIFPSK
jgi:hypothetical protein